MLIRDRSMMFDYLAGRPMEVEVSLGRAPASELGKPSERKGTRRGVSSCVSR